jgi:hypothetical protein
VKARETHALIGESIEIGSCDFSAEAAQVREAEVVGEDEEDVWLGRECRHCAQ